MSGNCASGKLAPEVWTSGAASLPSISFTAKGTSALILPSSAVKFVYIASVYMAADRSDDRPEELQHLTTIIVKEETC